MDIFSLIMYILIFIFYPICLGLINIFEQKNCTQKINGTYTGYAKQHIEVFTKYYPKFAYEFNNQRYESTTNQAFKKTDVSKFIENNKYTIFINENNPSCFIVKKHNSVGAYINILIGIIFSIILIFIK